MATYKYFYRRPDMVETNAKHLGKKWVNIHLLIGYTSNTIPAFEKMAKIMRKDFPFIKKKDIQFGQITYSTYCKGFTIATWGGYASDDFNVPSEWFQKKDGRMDYGFTG